MNEDVSYVLAQRKLKQSVKFPKQDAFVYDTSQFPVALCTRRAGKTSGLARKFKETMDRYPSSLCRYISLTRDSARDIMWPVLQEMNELFNWNAQFLDSSLTMILPNNSRLKLYGADMKNFIRRLRGAKSPATAIDEAQEFGAHLENLVDDILTPAMADYQDAWLALTGTPGPIPKGLFYDATELGLGDYSVHKWSLYENPYLPDAKGFVERLKKKKQWANDNPTYLREYCGRWVVDKEALLIKYSQEINHYETLPSYNWNYILGVDIGHRDADALAVLAWSESSPEIYLVEECITAGQDLTTLASQIDAMERKYKVQKIVMDEGGLGKKIAEEFRRRKNIPVHAAEKQRKMENVALLNDWLRLGKFKARSNSRFVSDSYLVQIDYDASTPDKIVVKKGFHSDIIDAVLYAFRESPAFSYQAPVEKPKWGTSKWQQEEVERMEEAAQDYFTELENQTF